MVRNTEQRIFICFLIFIMIIPGISSAEIPLPVQFLAGEPSTPIRIVISDPEVKKLSQFDETRTEQLNRLIRHITIDMILDQDVSRAAVLIDHDEIFSFLQKDTEEGTERIYSFEPNVIHKESQEETNNEDSLILFLDQILLSANHYANDFHTFFNGIRETFAERAKAEKTELRFSGFGKAVQRVTISFPADYVEENFPKILADTANSEICRKYISGLTFCGSQKIGLLLDENDKIVRITYDGKVGKTPDTLRKISLVWKCKREKDHQKDSITLKRPAVEGADKDNIILERDIDLTDCNNESYNWDIQIDHRAGKEDRKQVHFSAGLKNTDSVISGNIEYIVKRDGKNQKTMISMTAEQESTGEYKATLEIADYSGKIEKDRWSLHVQLQEGETVEWTGAGPATTNTKDYRTELNEESSEKIKPEDTIAELIIRKLFELSDEDLAYFSNEIPESMWIDLMH